MRQSPNLRYTECGRPQRVQRVYALVLYLGSRFALAIIDFLAKTLLLTDRRGLSPPVMPAPQRCANGKPKALSSALPASSSEAVVTIVMSMPRVRSTLS